VHLDHGIRLASFQPLDVEVDAGVAAVFLVQRLELPSRAGFVLLERVLGLLIAFDPFRRIALRIDRLVHLGRAVPALDDERERLCS